jgi:hypothetical protein
MVILANYKWQAYDTIWFQMHKLHSFISFFY